MTDLRNEEQVRLRRLLPEPGSLTPDEHAGTLRFEPPGRDRPYLVVNMVATVDGRATVAGRTAPISSVADRQLFHALRTRVDAVMVGAGTVRVERYGRLVRDPARRAQRAAAGLEADPLAIVVSASLNLPADLPLLQEPAQRVVVITSSDGVLDGVDAQVDYLRCAPDDLVGAVTRLRGEHGVRSILCEGGPTLNVTLLADGLVDELFLTTVPKLAGGAGALTIVGGEGAGGGEPAGLALVALLEHDGELFARYALSRTPVGVHD